MRFYASSSQKKTFCQKQSSLLAQYKEKCLNMSLQAPVRRELRKYTVLLHLVCFGKSSLPETHSSACPRARRRREGKAVEVWVEDGVRVVEREKQTHCSTAWSKGIVWVVSSWLLSSRLLHSFAFAVSVLEPTPAPPIQLVLEVLRPI